MNLSRILFATDFSARCEMAAQRILQLSHCMKELHILHVLSASIMDDLRRLLPQHDDANQMHGRLHDSALLQLQAQATRFSAIPQLQVSYSVELGRPHAVAMAEAAARDSLIVFGTHGDHAVRDWFQGSMLERVLSASPQPLLVVKQAALSPYQRVLVPVDFSASSLVAVKAAASIAKEAEMTLLHVFEIPFENKLRFAGITDEELLDYQSSVTQQAERDMAAFAQSLPDFGCQIKTQLAYGNAAEVILTEAEKLAADLIVVGRYGKSGVEQLLLGSVTECVASESQCDTLVING